MNFSNALELVKNGGRAAREGWNGKGMFIFLVNGSRFKVNREPLLSILGEGTPVDYHAHIDMRTADGQIVPWLASQTDVLADDWVLVGGNVKQACLYVPGTWAWVCDVLARNSEYRIIMTYGGDDHFYGWNYGCGNFCFLAGDVSVPFAAIVDDDMELAEVTSEMINATDWRIVYSELDH